MGLWVLLIFFAVVGACVGSFVNVVILRLPENQSVIYPPSRCPKCGHRLAWYDNVPVLGWLWLGAKCRYCKTAISVQYPLIEALAAIAFAGLFYVYYISGLRPTFSTPGIAATWPAFSVHLVLVAALIAATVIDARLYIIPLPIPWVVTAVAVLVLPVSVALGWMDNQGMILPTLPPTVLPPPVPVASVAGLCAAVGGTAGLLLAILLLRFGVLPRSFDDFEAFAGTNEAVNGGQMSVQEEILSYPHPRREVIKELLFVTLPLGAGLVGLAAGLHGPWTQASPPAAMLVLGGVLGGFLVGGAVVWLTRIMGTLLFGKEAMGLGDVHLMAGIGAVLGGCEATVSFFVAPFLGLLAVAVVVGIAAVARGRVRVIPYGPYLAAAALMVMIFRVPLASWLPIC